MTPEYRLNRFTTLPILLDMLSRRRITLLTPRAWEDRNDSYYIERYSAEKQLHSVVALCFTSTSETFHHWKVFSAGPSGVCIEFSPERLLKSFIGVPNVRFDRVDYLTISKNSHKPPLDRWPFLKRYAFRDEKEFRIIYESSQKRLEAMHFDLNLSSIRRITLSPWLATPLVPAVKEIVHSILGCSRMKVNRSTLIESRRWKSAIDGAADIIAKSPKKRRNFHGVRPLGKKHEISRLSG
jgi:hypothetical protein